MNIEYRIKFPEQVIMFASTLLYWIPGYVTLIDVHAFAGALIKCSKLPFHHLPTKDQPEKSYSSIVFVVSRLSLKRREQLPFVLLHFHPLWWFCITQNTYISVADISPWIRRAPKQWHCFGELLLKRWIMLECGVNR